MIWHRIQTYAACLFLLPLLALVGCGESGAAARPAADDRPVIVVSIHPLASLVEGLVDNWARVETLLPPGASPHGFELTPDRMALLSDARLLVTVGTGEDRWAEQAAAASANPGLEVLRFVDVVDLEVQDAAAVRARAAEPHHHHSHGHSHDHGADHTHPHAAPSAHLWLDPPLVHQFVNALAPRVLPLVPEREVSLDVRRQLMVSNIVKLDRRYRERLQGLANRQFVTFHNAFDVLAKRYDLEVVAHLIEVDLAPGGEITPGGKVQAIKIIQAHHLKVIYAEPQFPQRMLDSIAHETGAKVLRLDPLGHPHVEGYRTWFEMMESNLDTLAEGQRL